MVKWKFILMVILYVVLGTIAYFNFDFYHVLVERFGEKSSLNQPAWEKPGEADQTETLQEFQDLSTDQ